VHNARWPLDCLFDRVTFDLILIGGRGTMMDHPCARLVTLVSAVLVLSYGQAHTDRITDAAKCLSQ